MSDHRHDQKHNIAVSEKYIMDLKRLVDEFADDHFDE